MMDLSSIPLPERRTDVTVVRTWAAICALTFACDKRALTYLLLKGNLA